MATYTRSDVAAVPPATSSLFALLPGLTAPLESVIPASSVAAVLFGSTAYVGGGGIRPLVDPQLTLSDGSSLTLVGNYTVTTVRQGGPLTYTGTVTISGTGTGLVRRSGSDTLETITGASVAFSCNAISFTYDIVTGNITNGTISENVTDLDQVLAGADAVAGGSQGDTLRGYAGADTISGNGGDDTINVITGDAAAGESIDGGAGTDTLLVGGTVDLAAATLVSIERVDFNNPNASGSNTVSLPATFLSAPAISFIGEIGSVDRLVVGLGSLTSYTYSPANLTFSNWQPTEGDRVQIAGDSSSENITGSSGSELINGNDGNDSLYGGGGGDDVLDGGSGNDTLRAGAGNETLNGGSQSSPGGDTVDLSAATSDIVLSLVNLSSTITADGIGTDVLTGFEHAVSGSANDSLTGTSGSNTLDGGAGDDTLKGGLGNDTLIGGLNGTGGDTADLSDALFGIFLVIGSSGSAIATQTGAGFDSLVQIENVIGGSFNDTMTGNASSNVLDGGGGDDTLEGGGGSDTLIGGASGAAGDTADLSDATGSIVLALDSSGGGTATATGIGTVVLRGLENIIGGAAGDILTGNASANLLNGAGGIDILAGGGGDDTYVVESNMDFITELPGDGTDTVISADSHILSANVENVILTGAAGNGVIGNELANVITGNSGGNGITGGPGNDTIEGGAGSDTMNGDGGNDSMSGGAGSDIYFVDVAGDVVTEVAEVGVFDIIWTFVTTTLPDNAEILILNGALGMNGTGNDGAFDATPNLILGNNAANVLTTFGGDDIILGRDGNDTITTGAGSANGVEIISGGVGNDMLTSGGGHDFFTYESIAEGGDTITDFGVAGNDLDILDLRPMFFPTFTSTVGITTVAQAVASGHLTFIQAGANTQVFADANGGANNNVLLATFQNTSTATVQLLTLI